MFRSVPRSRAERSFTEFLCRLRWAVPWVLVLVAAGIPVAAGAAARSGHPARAASKQSSNRGQDLSRQPRAEARGTVPFFSPHSFWNQPVPRNAPLDRNSHKIVSALAALASREEQIKNGPWINSNENGIAVVTVGRKQRTVRVKLDHYPDPALTAAWTAVPIPRSAKPSIGDNDLAVWQPSTDTMWEFIELRHRRNGWHAEWGGAMHNVSQNPGVYGPDAWPGAQDAWGVTASSMPLVGGAMMFAELAAGRINHALAVAVPYVRWATFASPAKRDDGNSTAPASLPEGAHLRLDPRLNLARLNLPPMTRMMAEAAQRYGIIVRDYSPNIAFATEDPIGASSNPLPKLFEHLYPTQLLAPFPWRHLQLLRMDLHKGW
jgi:hypothetical protein